MDASGAEIEALGLHYAVPVGKYQWKVTSVCLIVPEAETEEKSNNKHKERKSEKEGRSRRSSSAAESAEVSGERMAIQNQVSAWSANVNSLLRGK